MICYADYHLKGQRYTKDMLVLPVFRGLSPGSEQTVHFLILSVHSLPVFEFDGLSSECVLQTRVLFCRSRLSDGGLSYLFLHLFEGRYAGPPSTLFAADETPRFLPFRTSPPVRDHLTPFNIFSR